MPETPLLYACSDMNIDHTSLTMMTWTRQETDAGSMLKQCTVGGWAGCNGYKCWAYLLVSPPLITRLPRQVLMMVAGPGSRPSPLLEPDTEISKSKNADHPLYAEDHCDSFLLERAAL